MLTLREQQQSLRRILIGPPSGETESDPWITEVLHSPGLAMTREIASWWLRFQIESQCIFTSRLMKRMGCYETYIDGHFCCNPTPPAIEELARQFLSSLASHPDPLLGSIAAFELECLTPSATQQNPAIIHWDRNPHPALDALTRGTELPAPEPGVKYILIIGPKDPIVPRSVSCSKVLVAQ